MTNISGEINALLSDKELNIYDELSKRDPGMHTFHKVYHYIIKGRSIYPWSDATIYDRFIRNIGEAKLRPDRLVNAWRQIIKPAAPAAAPYSSNSDSSPNNKGCSFNPFSWCRRKTKTAGGRLRRLGKSKSKKLRKR